jgi:subtilase family serine protease
VKLKFNYPAVADGSYYLLAQVDGAGAIPEANESNNVAASAAAFPAQEPFVNLSGAFVVPTPATMTRGRRSTARIRVSNGGNVAARGPLGLALSAATDASGATLAAPLRVVTHNFRLGPGASKVLRVTVVPPAELPAGTYYFSAALDSDNYFAEREEADNVFASEAPFELL